MSVDHDTIVKVLVAQRGKLLAYILTHIQDLHSADDIYQSVLMRALRDCGQIDGPEHLMNWARRVARNAAIDFHRAHARRTVSLDSNVLNQLEADWNQLDADPQVAMSDALGDCLSELSPQARRLVELRFADGLGMKQVAERVERPLQSVYVSMSRIYRQLSECIDGKLQLEHVDE